ncbi:MAG: D-isomer specific 2-hydroxyacid dehydrogenase NAD-binding [Clostridiales bacterium]|nr:D-isomer specific 2-hydroxyacid dehydrogenase NAD-binding [Clostridiales bacterium]
MYKVKCLNPISDSGLDLLNENYIITEDMDAEAILVRSADMNKMEIPSCLLISSRDIVGGVNWAQANKDEPEIAKLVEKGKGAFVGPELLGKKLGVIGLGAIGALVATCATKLGMQVIGYDPYITVSNAWCISEKVKRALSIDEIYEECDYITLHLPLLPETKNTICKETIAKMKDGVRILNFSRDTLVNDDNMLEALTSGKIAKYVTDFPNAKTINFPNTIAIPHLGASTPESEDNCAFMAVNQIMDYMENGNIINSVNYPECNMGVCQKPGRIGILHKNVPNMISQFATILGDANLNIAEMTNKSKKDWAYALIDTECPISADTVATISAVNGVVKARVFNKN